MSLFDDDNSTMSIMIRVYAETVRAALAELNYQAVAAGCQSERVPTVVELEQVMQEEVDKNWLYIEFRNALAEALVGWMR